MVSKDKQICRQCRKPIGSCPAGTKWPDGDLCGYRKPLSPDEQIKVTLGSLLTVLDLARAAVDTHVIEGTPEFLIKEYSKDISVVAKFAESMEQSND